MEKFITNYDDYIYEGLFHNLLNQQNKSVVKKLAKLAHMANLIIDDINKALENETHDIAKKVALASLKHLVFFRHTFQRLAKLSNDYFQVGKKKKELDKRFKNDWDTYKLEVTKLKSNLAVSKDTYTKYLKNLKGNNDFDSDKMIKTVLDLYKKI